MLREIYQAVAHWPWLHRTVRAVLDVGADMLAKQQRFSFPDNYIRRWKLNMLFGRYEPETYALFQTIIKPGMTVVDIGAHIGYYTRLFSRLVGPTGKVYAFEADPENYTLLVSNTRDLKNTEPVQLAITEKSGVIDFYHMCDKSGSHSILANVPLELPKRKIAVASSTLDSWLAREDIKQVDVIKMDIEGGERAALDGMEQMLRANACLLLIIEFAPAWIAASGASPQKFLRRLSSYGFRIFGVTEKGLLPVPEAPNERTVASLVPEPEGNPSYAGAFINLYCVKRAR